MTGQADIGGSRRGGRWRIALWGAPVLLLLLPAVAMRFTGEVKWGPADFIVMAILLFSAAGALDLAMRATGSRACRAGAAAAVAASFLLVWVNLAVGMIGSEDNPYNLLFAGVIAIALLGSALAQGLVAAGGLSADPRGALLGFMMAGLWLIAAWLFRKAAGAQGPEGASPRS